MVYYGADVKHPKEVWPEGLLFDTFAPHFKGPGWLSMQKTEGAPIEHIFIGVADPQYVAPRPRLRLITEAEKCHQVPMDVIKEALQAHGIEPEKAGAGGPKATLVAQLVAQSPEVRDDAMRRWAAKAAGSKGAEKRRDDKRLDWKNLVTLMVPLAAPPAAARSGTRPIPQNTRMAPL